VQEGRVRALGSDEYKKVECRFIAAMNRPLNEALESGRLRQDLYHRIAHCVVEVPPLRQRLDDLPELCAGILQQLQEREALNVFEIHPEVFDAFRERSWPGNIRELQAVVTNAAFHARFVGHTRLELSDLPQASYLDRGSGDETAADLSFKEQVDRFKGGLIRDALNRNGGNQIRTALELGVDRKMVKRFGAGG
jgi:transcriptional regulator with PAS, ATPase and Fis domain